MAQYLPLVCLILTHTLVDSYAIFVEPLWPSLRDALRLSDRELIGLMMLWTLTPSVSQVGFGYLQDRYGTRVLLLVGPLLAAVCLSGIGLAGSVPVLWSLLFLGGIGVGAFHPEAAVVAGRLGPEHRTRTLALFMFGGTCGLALGPVVSGNLVYHFGLRSLAWAAVPGVVLILALGWAGGLATRARKVQSGPAPGLREIFDGRRGHMLLLLCVAGLRTVPSVGMGKALAFVLDGRGFGEHVIGNTISVFLFSGGMGMLLTASALRSGWERNTLVLCPLAGIPFLLLMAWPGCPYWLMVSLLVPVGILLTGTMPAMVSYAQGLLPRGQGLASSVTMGLSWGIGGSVAVAFVMHYDRLGTPWMTIAAFAPCLALSAVGALFLPHIAPARARTGSGEPKPPAIPSTGMVPSRPDMDTSWG